MEFDAVRLRPSRAPEPLFRSMPELADFEEVPPKKSSSESEDIEFYHAVALPVDGRVLLSSRPFSEGRSNDQFATSGHAAAGTVYRFFANDLNLDHRVVLWRLFWHSFFFHFPFREVIASTTQRKVSTEKYLPLTASAQL